MRLILVPAVAALAGVLTSGGFALLGQDVANVDSDEVVAHLYDLGAGYGAKLPSLSCHESISILDLKRGEVKRATRLEGMIRVVRNGESRSPFTETHTFLTKDGVAAPEKFNLSYWVNGGFANALGLSHPEARGCNDFRVTRRGGDGGIRVDVAERADAQSQPVCQQFSLPGYRKTIIMDDAGHVLHVDRSVPADVARRYKEVSFAAMDYAPVKLGDETLWLPSRMESHDPKDDHRLEVKYSECQRFTGSIKILEGVTPVTE
jgi:hypothetical protein